MENLLIGGISGVVSRTLTAPFELAKIQNQNSFMPNSTLKDVIRKEGVLRLWKGNFTNCIRILPQNAINFYLFQLLSSEGKSIGGNSPIVNWASAAISGMVSVAAVYPLDNARTRLSLQNNNAPLRHILRNTKISSLYGGLRMTLIGFTPYNAFTFAFFKEYSKLTDNTILAGGLAAMSSLSITYPTDLIRRRLQLQGFSPDVPKYSGIADCAAKIYNKEGIRGLYRGLVYGYLKCIPTSAIQFTLISYLNSKLNI